MFFEHISSFFNQTIPQLSYHKNHTTPQKTSSIVILQAILIHVIKNHKMFKKKLLQHKKPKNIFVIPRPGLSR